MGAETKQSIFSHRHVVNLFNVCKICIWSKNLNTRFTLGDCLFGAVKLIKNADP